MRNVQSKERMKKEQKKRDPGGPLKLKFMNQLLKVQIFDLFVQQIVVFIKYFLISELKINLV